MDNNLSQLKDQLKSLEEQLQSSEIYADQEKLKEISQKYNQLKETYRLFDQLRETNEKIFEIEKLSNKETQPEMLSLIKEELEQLKEKKTSIESEINKKEKSSNIPESRGIILEIRAGTGGDEAAIFAGDLLRMYSRFAEKKGWKVGLISSHKTELDGFKEAILEIRDSGAYQILKNESGVHRVQRIPKTEKSGRLHTSTASVAVLPQAEPADLKIDLKDLKIDTFCASGHGGQNVQKTSSAVRITHLPTNLVIACQDERSQGQNKEKAMTILRSRLLAFNEEKKHKVLGDQRREQIGTAERSEKVRTYNFPQDRITDHRLNKSFFNMLNILDGNMDAIVESFEEQENAE